MGDAYEAMAATDPRPKPVDRAAIAELAQARALLSHLINADTIRPAAEIIEDVEDAAGVVLSDEQRAYWLTLRAGA